MRGAAAPVHLKFFIMKTDEEILYEIYHAYELKEYEKTKAAFDQKDFNFLNTHGRSYASFTRKEYILKSTKIDEVIKELTAIKGKAQDHEAFMTVEGDTDDNDESIIVVNSKVYALDPITICERSARATCSRSLWKLKHQPNGKDALRIRERIEQYKGN